MRHMKIKITPRHFYCWRSRGNHRISFLVEDRAVGATAEGDLVYKKPSGRTEQSTAPDKTLPKKVVPRCAEISNPSLSLTQTLRSPPTMLGVLESKALLSLLSAEQRLLDEISADFTVQFPRDARFRACCSLSLLLEVSHSALLLLVRCRVPAGSSGRGGAVPPTEGSCLF